MQEHFSQEELRCLARHNLPFNQLFDLQGRSAKNASVRALMQAEDKHFGYNAASCEAGLGHTLVTSSGHCIQCENGESKDSGARCVGETKNGMGVGEVYLAGSVSLSLIKVGSSKDSLSRVNGMRSSAYGGGNDWRRLIFIAGVKRRLDIEHKTQSLLLEYQVQNIFCGNQKCTELFSCSFETARLALEQCKPKGANFSGFLNEETRAKYAFSNRKNKP